MLLLAVRCECLAWLLPCRRPPAVQAASSLLQALSALVGACCCQYSPTGNPVAPCAQPCLLHANHCTCLLAFASMMHWPLDAI